MRRRSSEAQGRPVLFVLWCLGWVAVATLSLLPLALPIEPPGGDKLMHALAYAGMAAGAVTFCRSPLRLALLALLTAALGGAVEVAQGYVPGRQADVLDAIANTVGAALGYLAALTVLTFLHRRSTRRRSRRPVDAAVGAARGPRPRRRRVPVELEAR